MVQLQKFVPPRVEPKVNGPVTARATAASVAAMPLQLIAPVGAPPPVNETEIVSGRLHSPVVGQGSAVVFGIVPWLVASMPISVAPLSSMSVAAAKPGEPEAIWPPLVVLM